MGFEATKDFNLHLERSSGGRFIVYQKGIQDDQIAIMLNKDSGEEADLEAYAKMQEWRVWSSQVASKIIKTIKF